MSGPRYLCISCGNTHMFENAECMDCRAAKRAAAAAAAASTDAKQDDDGWGCGCAILVALIIAAAVVVLLLFNLVKGFLEGGQESEPTSASSPTTSRVQTAEWTTPRTTIPRQQTEYEALLDRLHDEAAATGYSGAVGQRMSPNIFESFTAGMLYVCREVKSGETTWEDEIRRDVSTGAPQSAANQFNTFLRDEFCPQALASR